LTLTVDLDLEHDLSKRFLSSLSTIMPIFIAILSMRSLFIGIYSLTLTFDLDLTNDLVKRFVAYLSIIVQGLIENVHSFFFYEFLHVLKDTNMAAVALTFEICT
jgi:hypothetical protein